MMTQTHLLLGSAVFAKPGKWARNTAVLLGGIVPDAAIFVLYGWERAKGTPSATIWNDIYFNSQFWKDFVAWGNSAPLYVGVAAIGLLLMRVSKALGAFVMFLGLASLLHIATDLPLHVNDAHRHLFPLSDWKFISPVSYWDPNHYGQYWSVFEVLLGLGLAVVLFRRFKSVFVRIALSLLIAAYIAVPAYFFLTLGLPG